MYIGQNFDNLRQMLKKQESEWEQKYAVLRKQFDALLEKNQNDLVKIRIREKTLNEKIAAIQLERQQEVRRLQEEIAILQGKLSNSRKQQPKIENLQSEEILSYQKSLKTQELEINQLKQENKLLSPHILSLQQQVSDLTASIKEKQSKKIHQIVSEQKSAQERTIDKLQKENEKQRILILRLKQQAKQHQADYVKLKAEKDENILQAQSARKHEVEGLKENNEQLQQDKKKLKSQWELANNKAQKLEIIKSLKEQQIKVLEQKLEQAKNQPTQILKCLKCVDIEQQLQLQKQMLKSVRMMLKFKEMELENLSK